MKAFKRIQLRDKFDNFSLACDTEELLESLKEDKTSFFAQNKRAWLRNEFPPYISNIDRQIRKKFSIDDNVEVKIVMYYPPELVPNGEKNKKYTEKELIINDAKMNVMNRCIISTITEDPYVSLKKIQGEKILLNEWTVYKSPPLVGGMLSYKFNNTDHYKITAPNENGHRSGCRCLKCKGLSSSGKKDLSKRYILVFDYILSTENQKALISKLMGNEGETTETQQDPDVLDAVNNLVESSKNEVEVENLEDINENIQNENIE